MHSSPPSHGIEHAACWDDLAVDVTFHAKLLNIIAIVPTFKDLNDKTDLLHDDNIMCAAMKG